MSSHRRTLQIDSSRWTLTDSSTEYILSSREEESISGKIQYAFSTIIDAAA
jgi:hypothetical protein